MNDAVLLDIDDGVAVVTLNRPDALNTLNNDLLVGLSDAYRRCDEDDAVRVVVVTGAGRAFCAGADLSDGGHAFDSTDRPDTPSCPLTTQAWEVRKPVIAACNGHAIGVGLGIAAQCDMRIVASEGKYGFLQNRRGVVTDFGMTTLLPKLVGFERAFDMLVRADRYNGDEIAELGLASRALPAAEVLPAALELARDMAVNCSPLVMGLHKAALWRNLSQSVEEGIALETRLLNMSMHKPDALEGGVAFFEKRDPNWTCTVNADWPDDL